jgi:flagellar basal-body rod modification protein FlgD
MTSVASATSGTQNASAAQSSAKTSTAGTVDYNSFLRILVTELQNQDPTAPNDPTQFVSQLASFSAVEQQVNANSKLSAILSSIDLGQAGSLIGRTVTASDGSASGQVVSVNVTSDGATATLDNGDRLTLGAGVTVS